MIKLNKVLNMQTDTQMYELGIQHAKNQMKDEKKKNNVKEIEDILYTKTGISQTKPVKHLKSLDFEKIHMIMYDLGIELLPEYQYLTEEQSNKYEESFRKFLIRIYYYINHKNDMIKKVKEELELANENIDNQKDDCEGLTKELEEMETTHEKWEKRISSFNSDLYFHSFFSLFFFIQNFFTICNIFLFCQQIVVNILNTITFNFIGYETIYVILMTLYSDLPHYYFIQE